ncbi:MAG: Cna B-type domain-containing protein, partial [Ruminococcus sp.]|nr:Cna B-type domain-containing protein [Ruminococcus sp.]
MSLTSKIKNKLGKKPVRRVVSGLLAAAMALTSLASSFPTITVEAASSDASLIELKGEDIIAQACLALGTSYGTGKGVTGSAYGNYGSFKSASSLTSLDCSGLVYWTLGSLGLSTSGYYFNNPVPLNTEHWLTTSSGARITTSTDTLTWTYKGVTESVKPAKASQKTSYGIAGSSDSYKVNSDGSNVSGYLRYWQKSETEDIAPGSIVIADPTSGAENHMWIYIGEFEDKDAVIAHLCSITKKKSSYFEDYVRDDGTAGTHWRIECASGSNNGVIIDNREDGKIIGAMLTTAYEVGHDGEIVLNKTFDDNGKYGADDDGEISITFTVTDNSSNGYSYSVTGTYNVSKKTWTQTSTTNTNSSTAGTSISVGLTSSGRFYFKGLPVAKDGSFIKYTISEKVNSGNYTPHDSWNVTLGNSKYAVTDSSVSNYDYRYERIDDPIENELTLGQIVIKKTLDDNGLIGGEDGQVIIRFRIKSESDGTTAYVDGLYDVDSKKWSLYDSGASSGFTGTYGITTGGSFWFKNLPVVDDDGKAIVYDVYESVKKGSYEVKYTESNPLRVRPALHNDNGEACRFYKTIENIAESSGEIVIKKTLDDNGLIGGVNGQVVIRFRIKGSDGSNYRVDGLYDVASKEWSLYDSGVSNGTSNNKIGITSSGSFYFKNIAVYDDSNEEIYYELMENVLIGSYENEYPESDPLKITPAKHSDDGVEYRFFKEIVNKSKSGQIVIKKTLEDEGLYGADEDGVVVIRFRINGSDGSSYYVDGMYDTSTGEWSEVASSKNSTATGTMGITSGGGFWFKGLRITDDNNEDIYYNVIEKVKKGSYEEAYTSESPLKVTPSKHSDDGIEYRFYKTIENTLPLGQIVIKKDLEDNGVAGAEDGQVIIRFRIKSESDGTTAYVDGLYDVASKEWSLYDSSASSGFTGTYGITSGGSFWFKNLPVVDDNGKAIVYDVYESVKKGSYEVKYTESDPLIVRPVLHSDDGEACRYYKTIENTLPLGQIVIKKTLDDEGLIGGINGQVIIRFRIKSESDGTTAYVDGLYDVNSNEWSLYNSSASSGFTGTYGITTGGSFWFKNLPVVDDNGDLIYYDITENVLLGNYKNAYTSETPLKVRPALHSDNGEACRYYKTIENEHSTDIGQIVLRKQLEDDGITASTNGLVQIQFVATGSNGDEYTVIGQYSTTTEQWTEISTSQTSSAPGTIGITTGGSFYFKELDIEEDDGSSILYSIVETVLVGDYEAKYTSSDPLEVVPASCNDDDTPYRFSTTVVNTPIIKVAFAKVDSNGDYLSGAVLQIIDSNGNVVDEWTTTDEAYVLSGVLTAGESYTLHEVSAPNGYVLADDVTFTAPTDGTLQTITMSDDTTKVAFAKVDKNGDYVSGAVLQVIDSNGNIVDEWTTTDEAYVLSGVLTAGETYTLHEVSAPNGYVLADDVTFTASTNGTLITIGMTDDTTKVAFAKVDENGDYVIGAVLQVIDSNSNIIDEWTTTDEAHTIDGVLTAGATYTLHEVSAPNGYVLADDMEFIVSTNGTLVTFSMLDDDTKVKLDKVYETNLYGSLTVGGSYQLTDENGNVISNQEIVESNNGYCEWNVELVAGNYTVTNINDELDNICVTVSTDGTYNIVDLVNETVVGTTYASLEGAQLQLLDLNGNVVDEWTSTNEAHYLKTILTAGETYIMHEVSAPAGYVVADDIQFIVSEDGSVDYVFMVDNTTKIWLSKKDITNDFELEGAQLQIIDSNGNVVDEWVSTTEPHYIEAVLTAGESYTLHEEVAPDGFVIANDITFTVSDDGSVDVVEMYDDTTKVKITKYDITNGEELEG